MGLRLQGGLNLTVIKAWMLGLDTPWFKCQLCHFPPKGTWAR